jgi:hypothetical protein
VNSWAAFIQRPSDLGFSDEGYDLPPLEVRWHEVPSDHRKAGEEADGQGRLLKAEAIGVVDASREKRDSLGARIAKMMELRAEDPGAHRLLWHDLEDERRAIEAAVPNVVSVYGAQPLDERERAIIRFSATARSRSWRRSRCSRVSGCNFQRHCAWAIFLGIGFKFNDFIQAIHRIQRFLQTKPVRIDLIYSEAERSVRAALEGKWKRHEEMCRRMSEIIREYGLGLARASTTVLGARSGWSGGTAARSIAGKPAGRLQQRHGVLERAAAERQRRPDRHLDPFSTQYEYTPSYNDFGHTDDSGHFFAQMDYLTPELLRVLKPGASLRPRQGPGAAGRDGGRRLPDRRPFHAECIAHYRRHGLFYMGMITVETDVVRENNQTYRLGWTEKCKDGSRMSVGMPEYVLLFRKAPSDSERRLCRRAGGPRQGRLHRGPGGRSTRTPSGELARRPAARARGPGRAPARDVYRCSAASVGSSVYDYERHVAIAQALEDAKRSCRPASPCCRRTPGIPTSGATSRGCGR